MSKITSLAIRQHTLKLPAFLPDATLGVVRGVDFADLRHVKIPAVVMNTFHLMQKPGSSTIQSLGGLHKMTSWDYPIITDSGGFQIYSLIHQNPKFGTITERGMSFLPEGSARKYQLSPEKSIQLQFSYDSDVLICLDDCTHVEAALDIQKDSVRRTVMWAKACKAAFEQQLAMRKIEPADRPLLFAVVQGGGDFDLRRSCAEQLLEIGFDGFGFGGWPLDAKGNLLTDILEFTRQQIPAHFPMHALGIGHPKNLVKCFQLGYEIFDCAMPTRDARHGRLYRFLSQNPADILNSSRWFDYVYIDDKKHIKDSHSIAETCDCPCCQNYSLGYLHHLFKINDMLFSRLATLHNLRFMTQLTEILSKNA